MSEALTLVIGNKNYSSWSMRAWVALRGCGVAFTERQMKFESQGWRDNIATLSPSGLVPVLWEGEPGAGFATWDTLAIIERAHELSPGSGVWPADPRARARARSLCAEMHGGFRALRGAMPMNMRSRYPGKGMNPDVAKDIARITALWGRRERSSVATGRTCLARFPRRTPTSRRSHLVSRRMGLSSPARRRPFSRRCWGRPAVRAWADEAVKETEFVAEDEPYATPPGR
jgi:glutathione S-transferase